MCSERYAEDTPLGLRKYQLPPTSSEASKHVCGTPKSSSALQAVSPLTPAPITHTDGSSPMARMLRPLQRARARARSPTRRRRVPVTGARRAWLRWWRCRSNTQSSAARPNAAARSTGSRSARPTSPARRCSSCSAWRSSPRGSPATCSTPATRYEQAIGTALTAVTLLLVALLKNAELRSEAAIQSKLDALATGMLEAIRNEGREADPMLERAIGIDEQL